MEKAPSENDSAGAIADRACSPPEGNAFSEDFSDVDEALAATKERLICDVCGNVVGANICNSSILIYITEKSDEDNIYIRRTV